MTSAFERKVKSVMQEVDCNKGELIPVDYVPNSISLKPYSLLSRKLSSSWFWKPRYTFVNLSIKDILEPSAPEPEPECVGPLQVSDDIDGKIQGTVAVESPIGKERISVEAAVSASSSASMSMYMLRVNPKTWDIMKSERNLQQPESILLQQLRGRGDDVFVITEVLQTKEEVKIKQSHSLGGSGKITLPQLTFLRVEGKGHQSQKKMVTLPPGSVLAFRVAKLVIGSTWSIILFPDEKKRTFESSSGRRRGVDRERHSFNLCSALCSPRPLGLQVVLPSVPADGTPEEEEFKEDFQGLCAEVKAGSLELGKLKMELRQQLLVDIGRILQDQPRLEALEDSLGQGLCSGGKVEPLDSPAGGTLECLVFHSGELVLEFAAPIFYLLGALNVLSETQRQLLAKDLERTVLSKQLELVEHILEKSTPWKEQRSVSLPSELLGDSWDEEAPTWVLLEECGLRLQVEPPQVHWKPTSQGPTCALYASLALLSSLGQKPH
ncbi:gasdermin-D-like [Grammomys surdaster]|uniref:gasdermin-D-like n=1 Tax=Grammomys surdaster TaxID=491861 RepID=UPI00109F4528|nr:gasdermin-D-like [Grammomys surdaster]